MKNKNNEVFVFSKEEREMAARWAEDLSWVDKRIYERDHEYMECVADIMNHPVFQSMEQFIQHGHTTCRAHCIQVSYMSYQICRRKGWDYRSGARGGLLHDLFLYDWHTHAKETGEHFHGYTHPRKALYNAEKYFDLTDMEKDMILRHMWPLTPIPPKYKEAYTIIYADKFCSLAEIGTHVKNWLALNVMPTHI